MNHINNQGKLLKLGLSKYADVRQRGLMLGVDFKCENKAHEVSDKLLQLGVLTKPTRGDTLRVTPAFIID